MSHNNNATILERGMIIMKMGFISGMIAGVIVGSAITMVVDPISDRDRRRLYRGTRNVFRKVGCVFDLMH